MSMQRPILRNAVLAAGLATPVLLLHGSASSSVMWTPVIHALKARFRLIAPDLIGYGRTDSWPEGYVFSLDDELRLIEPLIEHLPGGVHVVAHSYGGVVALALARAGRVGIRSLTLIEPVAFHMVRSDPQASADPLVDALRDVAFPVRLIAGDMSPLPVRRIAALIAEQLPNASLEVFAGANHLLPATHHRVLSVLLLEELS